MFCENPGGEGKLDGAGDGLFKPDEVLGALADEMKTVLKEMKNEDSHR